MLNMSRCVMKGQKMDNGQTKITLHRRLLSFHMEVGKVRKSATNPHFKSKYVDINGILAVIMPVLTSHGIILTQTTDVMESGSFVLKTRLCSADDKADYIECLTPLLMPDKTNPQKYGSALTYARRYALMCMLDLEAEDDDANYATQQFQQPNQNYQNGRKYNG